MNEKVKEQISALADGELPASQVDLLLSRMQKDTELRRTWDHYHLIGEALRNQLPDAVSPGGVADRVMQALDGETLSTGGRGPSRFLRPVASIAIAASVAVVAVLGVQRMQTEELAPERVAQVNAPISPAAVPGLARVNGGDRPVDHAVASQRPEVLGRYLVNHNEHAGSHGMQGMLSYVRIVGYDGDR